MADEAKTASDSAMPALEMPAAGKHASGSGRQVGYKVEVRTSFCQPKKIGDFTIDNVWREFPISEGATPWATTFQSLCWTDACSITAWYPTLWRRRIAGH